MFNTVEVEVTYKCTLYCKHCYNAFKKIRRGELAVDDYKKIFRELREIGVQNVHITGGEPLTRDDVWQILKLAKMAGFDVTLETNGVLLDKKKAVLLKKCGIDKVRVSIDGMRNTHDFLRGRKGLFDKTIKNIMYLKKLGMKDIEVSTSLNSCNYFDVTALISFLRKKGIKYYRARLFLPFGRGRENLELLLPKEKVAHVFKILKKESKHKTPIIDPDNLLRYPFPKKSDKFYITPYGKIKLYGFFQHAYGDLRRNRLKSVLSQKNIMRHTNEIRKKIYSTNRYINEINRYLKV